MTFNPTTTGWRIGRSVTPRGVELWARYDRTTGVFGEQGSGKTLDILAPALLAHDGPALATLTRVDDLLLTIGPRQHGSRDGRLRPVVVLDPFGLAPGLPELIWDPVAGCVDPRIAERRAKAFAAGTVAGSVNGGHNSAAAKFYAAETAKVLQSFLHAAALIGADLDAIMDWVKNPSAAEQPIEILRHHEHAARHWDGLLSGALYGSGETVANTITTVQQSLALFFQPAIRARCVPTPGRPATDLAEVIRANGTIYLLGREDPYASAAPLMTAVAEHVLDTALDVARASEHGRATPCFLACLDELPSTTPLPTLRTRMANERTMGLSFIYALQTWRQLVVIYGEDEARALLGLTNNLVIFGGGKDVNFYKEMSELLDDVRISRETINRGSSGTGYSRHGEDIRVLRPGDIRKIAHRHALIIAGSAPPIIAKLDRCIDGKKGKQLQASAAALASHVAASRRSAETIDIRAAHALSHARADHLSPQAEPTTDGPEQTNPVLVHDAKGWPW